VFKRGIVRIGRTKNFKVHKSGRINEGKSFKVRQILGEKPGYGTWVVEGKRRKFGKSPVGGGGKNWSFG